MAAAILLNLLIAFKKMKNRIVLSLLAILVASCFEKDEPLAPYQGKVTIITHQIEQYTSYFDFETNSIVDWHPSNSWDLGFSCGAESLSILTNSGAHWFLYNTLQSDIKAEVQYPIKTIWGYDKQSFYPDSTAASGWITLNNTDTSYSNQVYLLGNFSGSSYSEVYRIKFLQVNSLKYTFCYSPYNAPESIDTITIQKNSNRNFVYYYFKSAQIVDVEPDIHSYDLIFCPYYAVVTELGVTAPYLVRGVFLNNTATQATIDSVTSYENITNSMISSYKLSSQRDAIGFNWKNVTVNTSSGTAGYQINPTYNYIIKTSEGNYYKMRFLSYELNGENGYPAFEFKSLISP